MGYDFSNYQIFSGNTASHDFHRQLLLKLPTLISSMGYQPAESAKDADRIIVVGPPDRWVWMYDSNVDGDGEALVTNLSTDTPVVTISVWDDSFLNIFLYRDGTRSDQYCNVPELYLSGLKKNHPQTEYRAHDFYGQPDVWTGLLLNKNDPDTLKSVWKNQSDAYPVLEQMAQLIGWNSDVIKAGYIVYDEGMYEIPYTDYFEMSRMNVDLSDSQTYYFNKAETLQS